MLAHSLAPPAAAPAAAATATTTTAAAAAAAAAGRGGCWLSVPKLFARDQLMVMVDSAVRLERELPVPHLKRDKHRLERPAVGRGLNGQLASIYFFKEALPLALLHQLRDATSGLGAAFRSRSLNGRGGRRQCGGGCTGGGGVVGRGRRRAAVGAPRHGPAVRPRAPRAGRVAARRVQPVSYTHLTLPTIYSV